MSHERLVTPDGDMPTTRQLGHLAAQNILFAQRHDRLRVRRGRSYSDGFYKKFIIRPVKTYERPDILEGAPFGYLYFRTRSAQITQVALRSWNMHILDIFQTEGPEAPRAGSLATYSFSWETDREMVHDSRRQIATTPSPDITPDLYYEFEHMYVKDDMAAMWAAQTSFTQVSGGDIDLMMRDFDQTVQQIDSGERPYVMERKSNYMDYFAK